MRITKKWLKQCKMSLCRRTNELCRMDSKQVLTEYARCFPHVEQPTDECEALRLLLVDLIGLSFPDHLID